jgi:hypothetical protein
MTDVASTRLLSRRDPTLLYGVLALAVLSVVGAALSLAGDLSPTLMDALGPKGRLSIPLPMTIAQVVMAVAAGARRRPLALAGSGLLAVSLLAGVVSGFFDGGYADERLSGFEHAYQMVFVAALVVVGSVAAARFVRVLRAPVG